MLVIVSATLDAPVVHSYEYSVRHAFCTDYARNKSSIYSSTFQYDLQVAYNNCMHNADERIRQHEARKKQKSIEAQMRRKSYQEQQRRQKEQEAERLKNLTNNIEQIFR